MRNLLSAVGLCAAMLLAHGNAAADAFPPLIATWGSTGSGPGQLQGPGGLCAEGSTYLYVADQGNDRIQKWTTAGEFVAQWGRNGDGPGDLFHPTRVHLAPNGEIYVAEHQNHRISRFTRSGVFLGWFGDSYPSQVAHPVGVATDAAGNVYVASASSHRIYKFASDGTFLRFWGEYGSAPGQLRGPYAVALGPDGLVYVGEYEGCRVQKFTTDGVFVGSWGAFGTGPGQFNAVEGFAFDAAGDLYVADTGNDRIQKFTRGGTFLGELSLPHETGRPIPSDLAFDSAGNLFVIGAGSSRVYVYGSLNHAPDCSGAVARLERDWPPNHQLVPLEISGILDPDDDALSIRVVAITQDEPLQGDDQTCPDAVIDAGGNASIRLERLAAGRGGNGRVYHVDFEAGDGRETCHGSVEVCVPLIRGGSCDELVVDSTGRCKSSLRWTGATADELE